MKHKLLVILVALCSGLAAPPAFAQLTRAGETFSAFVDYSRGSAVGYDSRNNVYLVVNAQGRVNGRFVSADGATLGTPFVLGVIGAGQFAHLAFSPDANGGNGAFLVTWHESDGPAPSIHRRLVSYTAGFLTPDTKIVGNDTYWEIMGAPVVYSTVSHEFLVVWRQYYDTNIFGIRLNTNGDVISGVIPVAATGLFESDQSLTYNPANDEFFVVYRRGLNPTSVMGQRIKAGTGALVGGPSVLGQASTVATTGVTYNPATGQYLAAWHQSGDLIAGRVVAIDGTPLGNVNVLSTRVGTYDSLSVSADAVSGTVLMVGHDKLSVEVGGVEIIGAGTPLTGGAPLTASGGGGNHLPKVASNPTRRDWLVVASRDFAQTIAQRVSTSTTGSGGGGGGGSSTGPATRLMVDQPASGGGSDGRIVISGWAVDTAAAAGTGVDAVRWAFPAGGGAPTFVGAAATGIARPDVATYLGSSQFVYSGYQLIGRMSPGVYDIGVYARSTVANGFNTVKLVRVTILSPASDPYMAVDLPAVNQTLSQNILVSGWAIDRWAAGGSGIDAVHVWAYPIVGGVYQAPKFVGMATLGVPRGDVAAAFGMPQVQASGYVLSGTLLPGDYDVVVFARSTVSGTFNNWRIIRIRVV